MRTPLLFYSQVAWDTVWQRPQEQALGLAKYRPVIFLSPVQLHEAATRLKDRWQFHRTLAGGRLQVVSPLIFSGEYRSEPVRRANRALLRRLLGRVGAGGRFHFMTNSPFSGWMLPMLGPRSIIYDLIDDFCAFNWAPPEGRQLEDRIVRGADLAFAGTGYLRDRYENRLPGIEFLPSGVHFGKLTAPQPEPADLAALPRPRALYVGTLNDRMNGDLFAAMGSAFPGGSVAVVGPRHETFRAPALPPNVHFLGLKPHEQLPGYYQHSDLGIMPFADSPAARAINPIKTLEYLACGLPVLSTPIPDVIRYYQGVVTVAEPDAWVGAAQRMIAEDSDGDREARRDFARGRTWEALVEAMERRIRRMEAGAA